MRNGLLVALGLGLWVALSACSEDEGGSSSSDVPPLAGTSGLVPGAGAGGVAASGVAMAGVPAAGAAGTAGVQAGAGGTVEAGAGGAAGSAAGTGGGAATGTATFQVSAQLASDVNPSAPGTVGIVTWSIDATITEAHIEFGLDTSYGMVAPVDLAEADYRTLLLGMKPASSYHFHVVATDGANSYTSDDFVIETGPPTTMVSISNFSPTNEASRQRGFIVLSYWRGSGSAVPFILDADGDIVWWHGSAVTGGIARARMSADGKNMWIVTASLTGSPIERVSLDTLDSQVYPAAISSHDITPVSGATMAYLDYGESDCDSIFEIDPSGATKEVFESQGVVASGGGGFLGCHSNALRYSQAEDIYTFSDVNTDIYGVDRSGSVLWRLSEMVAGGNGAWGGTQHGHQLLDDSILVFANNGGLGASAFIEYTLQGAEVKHYDSGHSSMNLGDVQRLPGGNTLVTYSNDGIIQEIDASSNVVLEITGTVGASFGYALWRESLYGPPPDLAQ